METLQGKNTIQTYFEDYREVDGVKLPFAIRRSRPGFTWTYKFDEVKLNEKRYSTFFGYDAILGETLLGSITHGNRHLGEMEYIKGLQGMRGSATT